MPNKLLTVVGARPQFIKAAALSRAIKKHEGLTEVMVHTGQHFDETMSGIFFDELNIPKPLYNLQINGGGHGEMTGRMLEGLEKIISIQKPNIVIVYGDTNSTLAASLAAGKLNIPIAHVESGLRSFNRKMPEEINRVLTDHISALLFCPTRAAVNNLSEEGISNGVHDVGDIMYDATLFAVKRLRSIPKILKKLQLEPNEYSLATIHRAENTDTKEKLKDVLNWIKNKALEKPVLLPLHPRTRKAAKNFNLDFDGITLCEPVGYFEMVELIAGATNIFTDSGGLQKEVYFHKKPCVTLRDETEWVETVENGWNRLWKAPIYLPRKDISEYGDGHTAEKILDVIERFLKRHQD